MDQLPDCDQLPRRLPDPVPRRYEIMRPVFLDACTATERAAHTPRQPDTIGKRNRRFAQQGMLGLFPAHVAGSTRGRRRQLPAAAVQELQRLKGRYGGFHYRALGRMISYNSPFAVQKVQKLNFWGA